MTLRSDDALALHLPREVCGSSRERFAPRAVI
jgi:hypothetical protein